MGADDETRKRKKSRSSIVRCTSLLPSDGKKTKRKRKSRTGRSLIVRCENIFPSNLKYYFPSRVCSIDSKGDDFVVSPYQFSHAYPRRFLKKKPLNIVKGMPLQEDVVSLLSNGGKRDYLIRNNGVKVSIDSITGKYLLICCFAVPLTISSSSSDICRAMIAAYHKLQAANHGFEMVMVAKMSGPSMGVDHDEEASFNHFFSAFPCLAIPYSDTKSRNNVCFSLGLGNPRQFHSSVLLDPSQTVIEINGHCFFLYGTAAFPFDAPRLDAIHAQHTETKRRLDFFYRIINSDGELKITPSPPPVSLIELLGNVLLYRSGRSNEVISVSQLSKKKCVALYICYDTEFMPQLKKIQQRCQEFEVVLVHLAVSGEPGSFVKNVELQLEKLKISSWWVMPFQEEVSRRLWWLNDTLEEDQLIFLADGENSGQLNGREFLSEIGEEHYPFTRKSLLDKTLSSLKSLTLESLMRMDQSYDLHSCTATVPVSELKGKRVLIYMDWEENGNDALFNYMLLNYNRIKKKFPGSEVVFVSYKANELLHWRRRPEKAPWLFLPFSAAGIEGEICNRLMLLGEEQTVSRLIAFGKDGFIRSISVQDEVARKCCINYNNLFVDTLEEDIFHDIWQTYRM